MLIRGGNVNGEGCKCWQVLPCVLLIGNEKEYFKDGLPLPTMNAFFGKEIANSPMVPALI